MSNDTNSVTTLENYQEFILNPKYLNLNTYVINADQQVGIVINGTYGGYGYSDLANKLLEHWKKDQQIDDTDYNNYSEDRTSPYTIAIVELLKDKVNSKYASLYIKWIDRIYFEHEAYEITEYDGSEDIRLYPEKITSSIIKKFNLTEDTSESDLRKFVMSLKKLTKDNFTSYSLTLTANQPFFNDAFNNREFSDLTITSVENEQQTIFYVHRIVVISWSAYLKTLIKAYTELNNIDVECNPVVLEVLLKSMYNNELNFSELESNIILKCIILIMKLGVTTWLNQFRIVFMNMILNDDIVDEYLSTSKLLKDSEIERVVQRRFKDYEEQTKIAI
jgi:hypothetical protein